MVEYWTVLLYIVIVLSITIANLFAIRQSDLKRFMAFSSISQAGYIMLAVVGNSAMSVSALTYYVLIYVVANLSVFTIISSIEEHNNGSSSDDSYNGLYKTNPRLAFLMTLALFSLGGIPPFAGRFEVLRVHGSSWYTRHPHHIGSLGIRRSIHRVGKHSYQLVLLSAHREGYVYQAQR